MLERCLTPLFVIQHVALTVDIFIDYTVVTSALRIQPQRQDAPVLHGVDLELITLTINGS